MSEAQSTLVGAPEPTRVARIGLPSAVVLVVMLGLGIRATNAVGWYRHVEALPADVLPQFDRVPYRIGPWSGKEDPLDPTIRGMLGVDEVMSRRYTGPAFEVKLLVEVQFGPSRDSFHYPDVCMPGHGWGVLKTGTRATQLAAPNKPLEIAWELMAQERQYMLVSYWLWTPDGYAKMPSGIWRKVNAVGAWERLTTANPQRVLFLAYTPVEGPEDLEKALDAQVDLATRILPPIETALKDSLRRIEEQTKHEVHD